MLGGFTSPRRVAITGFGCVTPIGIGRDAFWESLRAGRSGIRRIESFDPSAFAVQIAGEIPEFDPETLRTSGPYYYPPVVSPEINQ